MSFNSPIKTIRVAAAIICDNMESPSRIFATAKGYGEFKREVADKVCELLATIQDRYAKFNNQELLDNIVKQGANKARITAKQTLARATKNLGLN